MADNGTSIPPVIIHNQSLSKNPLNLEELIAQATAKYARKEYSDAADLYSRATELQAESNGEMSPLNAELLFCYGRSLYQVALLSSDVLGSKVTKEANVGNGPATAQRNSGTSGNSTKDISRGGERSETSSNLQSDLPANFQFQGDDNYGASDHENDDEATGADATEEEDEFSNAFEILDLARVLLLRRLQELPDAGETRKSEGLATRLRERLADTYDLQAEISLEGERFTDAANDLKAALDLKTSLYPAHSSLIAETHYKLSLALDFASVSSIRDKDGDSSQHERVKPDEAMRQEAADHMKAAIACCELQIHREEDALANNPSKINTDPDGSKKIRTSIKDVQDMIQDMQQRLVELQQPFELSPKSRSDGDAGDNTALRGVFATILGQSPQAQKATLEQAADKARDLTGLVKKKKTEIPREISPGAKMPPAKRKADSNSSPPRSIAAKRTKADNNHDLQSAE